MLIKKPLAKFKCKCISKGVFQPPIKNENGVTLSTSPVFSLSFVNDETREKVVIDIELEGEFRESMKKIRINKPCLIKIYQ